MTRTARRTAVATALVLGAVLPVLPAHAGPTAAFVAETKLDRRTLPSATVSGTATVSPDCTELRLSYAGATISSTATTVTASWKTTVYLTGEWLVGRQEHAYYNHRLMPPRSSFELSMRVRRQHATARWSRWSVLWGKTMIDPPPDLVVEESLRVPCVIWNDTGYRGFLHVEMRYVAKLNGTQRGSAESVVRLA